MPKKNNPKQVITLTIRPSQTISMIVAGVILFAVFSVLWVQKIYNGPQQVFWGMVQNNLRTSGVTKRSVSDQGGQKVDQYTQLSFVDPIASRSYVDLSQGGGENSTAVKSETIGTKTADYSRYITIRTNQKSQDGKSMNFDTVQGVWGKTDQIGSTQYYRQAALGLLVFANLDRDSATKITKTIRDQQILVADYSKTKSDTINGKHVWTYAVKLDIAKYITVLKENAKILPIGNIDELDPEQYKSNPPVDLKISVGKYSRQIVQTETPDGQKEDYLAYGLKTPIVLPEKTIPISELQKRLQQPR